MRRNPAPNAAALLVHAWLAFAAAACSGDLGALDAVRAARGYRSESACGDVPTGILAVSCAGAVCHDPGAEPAGGLDLVSPGIGERLLGVPSSCNGTSLLIDPVQADASFLIEKLGNPSCGEPMPLLSELSDEDAACLREWVRAQVSAGAPPGVPPLGDGGGTP